MKRTVNIGILGFGNIGSAVDRLISVNGQEILEKTGIELKVKKIADISDSVKHPLLTKNADEVINDPEISVVVETIGGEKPALDFILSAIKKGKHVVTSNKMVIALHLEEILKAAKENKVCVLFEASVGGGIPILTALRESLSANKITEVFGIVNGTTNYILSRMTDEGLSFEMALTEAQRQGFAEANPKLDIEGYDAAYKAAILAAVAFGAKVGIDEIPFEGITKITADDIRYAEEMGYSIKLIASAKKIAEKVEVSVHPTLIPSSHALSSVSGPMNAIYVKGNMVGELMFYGAGAGGNPTASAVVSDILQIVSGKCQTNELELKKFKANNPAESSSRFYLRMEVLDKTGVLAEISKIFAEEKVSIAGVKQKETVDEITTLVIVVHEACDADLNKALGRIKELPVVKNICNIIRVGL